MKIKEQQIPMNVDLKKASTITCAKCGNATFIHTFILKKLSPLASPTGKEMTVPVQLYACGNCGELLKTAAFNDII